MSIRVNGSTISNARARLAGSWRPVVAAWAKVDGEWRKVFPFIPPAPPITGASISPSSQQWSRQSATDFRASASAGYSGGTGPFGFNWAVSGGAVVQSGQGTANATFRSTTGAPASISLTVDDYGSGTSAGATPRPITEIPAPSPLVATVAPASREWSGSLGAFTAAFTASGAGGSGAYAYSWSVSNGGTVVSGQGTPNVVVGSANGQAVSVTLTLSDVNLGTSTTGSASVAAKVFPALSVSAAPSSLAGSGSGSPVTTSGSATATVSGGSGSWVGAWEWDGGNSTGLIVPVNGSAATTAFQSGDTQTAGTSRARGMRYRVTDNVTGAVAFSNSVVVTLTRAAPNLTVSVSPSSLSGSGTGDPIQTTGSATATVSGGSGSWTLVWVYDGTGTGGFNPVSNTATTAFRASPGQARGTTVTGGFFPRVTDTVTGQVVDGPAVAISLTREYLPMSVSTSPGALAGSGTGSPIITAGSATASVSGGSGSWTVAWVFDGTGTGFINPTASTSATTTFRSADQAPGTTRAAGFFPRVTDSVTGQVADGPSVAITLTRNYTTMTASATPSSLSGSSASTPVVTSGSATCTASGGSGSRSYSWEWDGGNSTGSIVATNAGNATTTFRSGDSQAQGTSRARGMRCRVTDTVTGQVVVTNSVVVSLSRTSSLSVLVSPPSQPWPASAPYRVTTTASASGGTGPYTYAWNDTGPQPYPPGSGYVGTSITWESVNDRNDQFVSVTVTDALGATAVGSAAITELGL